MKSTVTFAKTDWFAGQLLTSAHYRSAPAVPASGNPDMVR
jgi:hypothetical protein